MKYFVFKNKALYSSKLYSSRWVCFFMLLNFCWTIQLNWYIVWKHTSHRRSRNINSTQLNEHVRTQVLTPQCPHLFNTTTYETTHLLLHVLIYLQFVNDAVNLMPHEPITYTPTRHLDESIGSSWFIRFCRTDMTTRQTDTYTDISRYYVLQ